MKPFAEQMETSGMNSRDGEHENLQWSLSITNVPCSVFEDENTKVRFDQTTSKYLLIYIICFRFLSFLIGL